MLVCSPLLQLRLIDCDLLSLLTRVAAVLCRLLLLLGAGGGGEDGMLTLRLGDVCCLALPVDSERSSNGADGSTIAGFSVSCNSVGMIRLGGVRLSVYRERLACSSLAPPKRKRRH